MDRLISASYVWNLDMLIAAQEAHRRIQLRPFCRGIVMAAYGLLPLMGVVLLFTPPWFLGVEAIALAVILPYLLRYARRFAARRHYRSRTDRDAKVKWTFSDEGVSIWTNDVQSTCRWAHFSRFVELPDAFMLYINNQMFQYLPKSAFDPDDIADFSELARTRVGPGASASMGDALA